MHLNHCLLYMCLYFLLLRRFMEMKHYSDELQSHTSQLLRTRAVSLSFYLTFSFRQTHMHTNTHTRFHACLKSVEKIAFVWNHEMGQWLTFMATRGPQKNVMNTVKLVSKAQCSAIQVSHNIKTLDSSE